MCQLRSGFAALVAVLLLGMCGQATVAYGNGMDLAASASNDPPGNLFPGQYFQYKAQF